MKYYNIVAGSMVNESIKREFVIEAEDEKVAKDEAMKRIIAEESDGILLDSPTLILTSQEIDPKPHKITDIFDNMEFYIAEMRKVADTEKIPADLKQYAWEYFREIKMSEDELKKLAIFIVDKTYRVAAHLMLVDKYTMAFFAKVIPFFWDTFQGRGVDIFYIVDNTFKNDGRFEVIVQLFELTGIAVIKPYAENENLNYEIIEKQIKDQMSPIRMMMYIEKDASVNYLEQVKKLATSSKYLVISRSKGSTDSRVELL